MSGAGISGRTCFKCGNICFFEILITPSIRLENGINSNTMT
jgi:hypothetical protein